MQPGDVFLPAPALVLGATWPSARRQPERGRDASSAGGHVQLHIGGHARDSRGDGGGGGD